MTATPRPWRLDLGAFGVWGCHVPVAACGFFEEMPKEEATANAVLIVEAVNAYDALRAENGRLRKACRLAKVRLEGGPATEREFHAGIIAVLDAALEN